MPTLFIHLRNSYFHSRDEGKEYVDVEAALASGLTSAVLLIADEINDGGRSAAVEVIIAGEDGTGLRTSVVTTSVSDLLTRNPDPPRSCKDTETTNDARQRGKG